MRSRLLILIVLTALLAGGCAEAEPDLYAAVSDAQATQSAARAGLRATEKAVERERVQATVQAARTQGAAEVEIDLLEARSQATQAALDIEFQRAEATEAALMVMGTRAAADQYATATAAVEQIQATNAVLRAYATQTAVVIESERSVARAETSKRLDQFWPMFGVSLLLLSVFMVIKIGKLILDWWLTFQDRRNRHHYTPVGIVMYDPDGSGGETARLMTGQRHIPSTYNPEVRALTPSGSVLAAPMAPPSEERKSAAYMTLLALQLVQDAVSVAGEDSVELPGWRDLPGWTSDRWQRVKAALQAAEAVISDPGKGTFVTEPYQNLGYLLFSLETKNLKVKPVRDEA